MLFAISCTSSLKSSWGLRVIYASGSLVGNDHLRSSRIPHKGASPASRPIDTLS